MALLNALQDKFAILLLLAAPFLILPAHHHQRLHQKHANVEVLKYAAKEHFAILLVLAHALFLTVHYQQNP